MSPYEYFEDLVRRILTVNRFSLFPTSPGRDPGFDFRGTLAKDTWAIEVKFYRTPRAQPSLIETAALRLNQSAVRAGISRGMLIVSSYLPAELRHQLEKAYHLTFVDRVDLANWAASSPTLLSELQSFLEIPPDDVVLRLAPRSTPNLEGEALAEASPDEDLQGSDLCKELRALGKGKKHWAAYESLCERILRYLFSNDLHGWHKQKRTDDGLNRYDFVCRVRSTTDFWQFVAQHLNSRYVIFEFKNYSEKIKQGQVLTTEKYLLEKALRRVGIIFTRVGADRDALAMTQGAMREHGKLMIVLDDEKVCGMLHRKERGEDPTDLLFDLADDFLLALPR